MPSVEIVTVGTELLLGDLVDTNGAYIARELAAHGIDVFAKHSIGDNVNRLAEMIGDALSRADGVITTGGLGPTVDDVTKEAVAAATARRLTLHEPSVGAIEARLRAFGRTGPIGENNLRQAMLPEGALVLDNPNGTAPGFVVELDGGGFVASMPGVPREMQAMLAERLIPWLADRYHVQAAIYTRTLHAVGMAEAELDRRIDDLFRTRENPKIAVLAHESRIDVRITAKAADQQEAAALIGPLEHELRERIGSSIVGADDESLEAALLHALAEAGLRFATAESITGGAIADAVVRVPGASAAFRGGVVAYDDDIKTTLLGVDKALLREHGAVSEQVAVAMAQGARRCLAADVAVSTTGIAGPSGGTAEKPVGLVWFGLALPDDTIAQRCTFPGTRDDVRRRSVTFALNLAWRHVRMKAR